MQDFKMLEATKKISERQQNRHQSSLNVPFLLEAVSAQMWSQMNEKHLSALVSLKQYFKNREHKECFLDCLMYIFCVLIKSFFIGLK